MREVIGGGLLLTLSLVLLAAAIAKLRQGARLRPAGELLVAGVAILAPAAEAGAALAAVFAAFALAHLRGRRGGEAGCDCFGASTLRETSAPRATVLTAASAAAALAVAGLGGPSVAQSLTADPRAAAAILLGAGVASVGWRLAFSAPRRVQRAGLEGLARTAAFALERRLTRRTALERVALAATALAVAPLRYLLYPGSAMAAILPSDCSSGLCTDGYTAFCCELPGGLNSCPAGTFAGGWWMCTDYAGSLLCAEQGVRYYVDCNALPGQEFAGGCRCAGGSCDQRRVACNVFRYGQCNVQLPGVTAVVCRMILCENPSTIPDLNCSASLAVDDAVCGQEAPCLEPTAVELAGAGGV